VEKQVTILSGVHGKLIASRIFVFFVIELHENSICIYKETSNVQLWSYIFKMFI